MSTIVKFKYTMDPDYEPCYVNGVYGGMSATGELVANFYFERIPIPYEEQIELDDENMLQESKITDPDEFKVRRAIKTGVVMDVEHAKDLYYWLGDILSKEGVLEDYVASNDDE